MATEVTAYPCQSKLFGPSLMVLSDSLALPEDNAASVQIKSRHGYLDGQGVWHADPVFLTLQLCRDPDERGHLVVLPPIIAAALSAGLRLSVQLTNPPVALGALWRDVSIGGSIVPTRPGSIRTKSLQIDTAPSAGGAGSAASGTAAESGREVKTASSVNRTFLVLAGAGICVVALGGIAILVLPAWNETAVPAATEPAVQSPPPTPVQVSRLECSSVDMTQALFPLIAIQGEWSLAGFPGTDWEIALRQTDRFACESDGNRAQIRELARQELELRPSDFATALVGRY